MVLLDHEDEDKSASQGTQSKRGRPKGSMGTFHYWTRVISFSLADVDLKQKHEVHEDLRQHDMEQEDVELDELAVDEPIFNPKTFF